MTPAISISGLSKHYGNVTALDDVSLTVNRGELFGLIGPDGAGKSSLYRILATLTAPDTGTATVAGLDTVADYRVLRTKIGYMPERFSLYPDLSVSENLNFFASIFGVSAKDNFDLIAPVFSQLERFRSRPAGKLSGGMKQKLALSCALIHRPEVLLLDEPTTGVDAVSRSEFWQMLNSLRKEGITIMVSTSYMDEATLCDRIAMIDSGRILDIGSPAELVAGFNGKLYDATAGDMFGLLNSLREMPFVSDCYTFGATLRVVAEPGFDPEAALVSLRNRGFKDVTVKAARPVVEDLFIQLTSTK